MITKVQTNMVNQNKLTFGSGVALYQEFMQRGKTPFLVDKFASDMLEIRQRKMKPLDVALIREFGGSPIPSRDEKPLRVADFILGKAIEIRDNASLSAGVKMQRILAIFKRHCDGVKQN